MRKNIKLCIFALVFALLVMTFTVTSFATDAESSAVTENTSVTEAQTKDDASSETENGGKLDMDEIPPFTERVEIALQGTVTGMVMVFAVLALLAIIVSASKVVFYDIPSKKREEAHKVSTPAPEAIATPVAPVAVPEAAPVQDTVDDGELAAVITAAIAAMIESGDYKNEFVGGFRVVSFKRSTKSAWNRK